MKPLRISIYLVASCAIAEWCWFLARALYMDSQNGWAFYYSVVPIATSPMLIVSFLAILMCLLQKRSEKPWWR